jgi:hypothetical protein
MQITISIPIKADITGGGSEVNVSAEGESWQKGQLGDYADRRGVYIHHSNGKILYVGKTTVGKWGTFGERLRREFQATSSSFSDLHRLLAKQDAPIYAYLLDLGDIDMMVDSGPISLSPERKALLMEQVLIGIYEPEGNKA